MNFPEIIVVIFGLFTLGALAIFESNAKDEYKKLLIDFGHARYIVNPQTGVSHLEIDKPINPQPNK